MLPTKARRYGVAHHFEPIDHSEANQLVFQFQYRKNQQKNLACSGGYLKYLLADDLPEEFETFTEETKYAVMFGPDMCGTTNRVQFILQIYNPSLKKYVEHHLTEVIPTSQEEESLYKAILDFEENQIRIEVDGNVAMNKNWEDVPELFEPPLDPPEVIIDEEQQKPDDWDDEEWIDDPEDIMPEDWPEPLIPNPEAVKPSTWLDDAPLMIPDPDAEEPDDWDEEKDGEWEPPEVDNPDCEEYGCGEWKADLIDNPNFVGKWEAERVENPNYAGPWEPEEVDNPGFYDFPGLREVLGKISAVAIEVWVMDEGMQYKYMYVGTDNGRAAQLQRQYYDDKVYKTIYNQEKEEKKKYMKKKSIQDKQARVQAALTSEPMSYQKLILNVKYYRNYVEENIVNFPFFLQSYLFFLAYIIEGREEVFLQGALAVVTFIVVYLLISLLTPSGPAVVPEFEELLKSGKLDELKAREEEAEEAGEDEGESSARRRPRRT